MRLQLNFSIKNSEFYIQNANEVDRADQTGVFGSANHGITDKKIKFPCKIQKRITLER